MPPKGKRKHNPGRNDNRCPPLMTRLPVPDHPEPPSPTLADAPTPPDLPIRSDPTPQPDRSDTVPEPAGLYPSLGMTALTETADLAQTKNTSKSRTLTPSAPSTTTTETRLFN